MPREKFNHLYEPKGNIFERGIIMNESTIRARRQTMVGMITKDLKALHDKAPEAHEEILKLTKDMCKLICLDHGYAEREEKVNNLYERIIAKF